MTTLGACHAQGVEPALRNFLRSIHRDLPQTMGTGVIGKAREQQIRIGIQVLFRRRLENCAPPPRASGKLCAALHAHQDVDQGCEALLSDGLMYKFVTTREAQIRQG